MASIIKRIMRHFNGTDWDKYYPETSADQVKFTKPDGTESDLQTEVSGLNSKTTEVEYSLLDVPISTLYEVKDFLCIKKDNQVFLNASIIPKSGTQINADTQYNFLGGSLLSEELRPRVYTYIDVWGCNNAYGNTVKCSTVVNTSGEIMYATPSPSTYYKVSGTWFV